LVAGSNPAGPTNDFNDLAAFLKANSRLGTSFGTNFGIISLGLLLVPKESVGRFGFFLALNVTKIDV
tara:strand:- start:951 stop:1151 length:201 start_codon:yes stop_codon:yes gene_type:complete